MANGVYQTFNEMRAKSIKKAVEGARQMKELIKGTTEGVRQAGAIKRRGGMTNENEASQLKQLDKK